MLYKHYIIITKKTNKRKTSKVFKSPNYFFELNKFLDEKLQ